MASRLNRARAMRTAVAVAAVAAPLAAAGSAQAAIAGASPSSTTNLPDLVSATATSASTIQVCYDKALTSVVQGDFVVSNYLSGDTISPYSKGLVPTAATIDSANNKCVDLTINELGGNSVLGDGTIVTGVAGAVTSSGGSSLADSTTLTSSQSQTGTEGHTAGPDLSSVKVGTSDSTAATVPPTAGGTNTLVYTFDKNVDPNNITPADFGFEYVNNGGTTPTTVTELGTSVQSVTGNVVTINFNPTTGAAPTASATEAFVENSTSAAVYSANNGNTADEVGGQNGNFSIGGVSTIPSLVSATLNSGYTSVTYTFDHPVGSAVATAFHVALSDGSQLSGVTDTISGNTVTVNFPGTTTAGVTTGALSPVAEYATLATVDANAVSTSTTAPTPGGAVTASTPGAAPIGGNAGLFARGYTTGPDVQAVVSEGTNQLGQPQFLVYLDQRVGAAPGTNFVGSTDAAAPTTGNSINLLSSTGAVVDTEPTVTVGPSSGPGQQQVLLTFTQTQTFFAGSGTQVQFPEGIFTTALGPNSGTGDTNGVNVPQIDSITATAAHAKGIKMHKATKKHVARKRVARKHIARKHVTKKHGR
ncbi:hypothetical protein [Conexibacter sp. DBS9H8]|uniref:hypothetical protein n=1 Tax=Conexibacter sp. DBS9H8 TaxID=2937801 RepID=UPI00200BA308|nr:hypothetical protein [Conexibacter sp. DBS9H8]